MYTPAHRLRLGFTLIEIVVVVGIMGVLMAVGVASYGRMNDRAKIEQAAVSVSTQLRTWQKQAESGIGSKECSPGQVYGGLEVSPESPKSMQAVVVCDGSPSGSSSLFIIPSECKECVMSKFDAFTFRPLGLGSNSNTTILISNPNVSVTYSVTLTLSGGIDVQKNVPKTQ